MSTETGRQIATILRDARHAKGITQAGLAQRAGVARETVYRIEQGRLPTPDVAVRLCDVLGVDRDQLDLERPETDPYTSHPPSTLLRDRRRALGLTLAQCAEAAEISPATLSRFERGVEQCAKLVDLDAGWPMRMNNPGFAQILDFRTVADLDRFWRTGELPRRAAGC